MDDFFNKHYIVTDDQGRITDGWSDGPHRDRDTTDAVCINEQGGYQFRLSQDGEENPVLRTYDEIPLYRWDGEQVIQRTEEEIAADRTAIPTAQPSALEQMRADIDYLSMMSGIDLPGEEGADDE